MQEFTFGTTEAILIGSKSESVFLFLRPATDVVVDESVYESFLANHDCHVEITEEGEHWFHTPQQMNVMKKWEETVIYKNIKKNGKRMEIDIARLVLPEHGH